MMRSSGNLKCEHLARIKPKLKLAIVNKSEILRAIEKKRPEGTRSFSLRGGSVRIEPSRQLLDDCTHKRNSKRKVGKPIYH